MILEIAEQGAPIVSEKELLDFLEIVPAFPHIAIDTEGDFDHDPPIFLGFSAAYLQTAYYFPVAHMEKEANIDRDLLEYAMKQFMLNPLRVFHNAAHDLTELEKLEFSMWQLPYVCTMIAAHMVNENLPSKSLDSLHKIYTGGEGKKRPPLMQDIIDTMGWRYVPVSLMNVYAPQDAIATSELFKVIEPLYVAEFGPFYESP